MKRDQTVNLLFPSTNFFHNYIATGHIYSELLLASQNFQLGKDPLLLSIEKLGSKLSVKTNFTLHTFWKCYFHSANISCHFAGTVGPPAGLRCFCGTTSWFSIIDFLTIRTKDLQKPVNIIAIGRLPGKAQQLAAAKYRLPGKYLALGFFFLSFSGVACNRRNIYFQLRKEKLHSRCSLSPFTPNNVRIIRSVPLKTVPPVLRSFFLYSSGPGIVRCERAGFAGLPAGP